MTTFYYCRYYNNNIIIIQRDIYDFAGRGHRRRLMIWPRVVLYRYVLFSSIK